MAAGHSATRMSEFEAVMWELERDPHLASAFANLTLLDRPPNRTRFRARMERACAEVPRLRQHVVPAPAHLGTPEWRDDPDFDLDHHLRWVDLGGDATTADVLALAADLSRHPFDRARPLWEFVTVEGLADGSAAMVQRMHHTLTDGEGGIRLSVAFLDLERDPPDPGAAGEVGRELTGERPGGEDWVRRASRALGDSARRGADLLSSTVGSVGELVRHPTDLPRIGGEVAETARSALRQARVDGRRSPLWTDRSLERRMAIGRLELDDVRRASAALGGSINDLFVAGAADAAGRVHRAAGTPVDELRVSIPVSTRAHDGAPGNSFSPTQTLMPTGEMDPAERFARVHAAMGVVKSERSMGLLGGAAAALHLLPGPLLVKAGQRVTASVDFVCSNVRAAPFDLYLGGALITANHPIGPLAGTAFNLTVMSYRGTLFLGLITDAAAIADPSDLMDELERSYATLLAAGGVSPG
jgi:diacylglycerol O-acyltransferase / wax synthase